MRKCIRCGCEMKENCAVKIEGAGYGMSCHILLPPVTGILFLQPRNRLPLFRRRKQTDSEENSGLFSSVS